MAECRRNGNRGLRCPRTDTAKAPCLRGKVAARVPDASDLQPNRRWISPGSGRDRYASARCGKCTRRRRCLRRRTDDPGSPLQPGSERLHSCGMLRAVARVGEPLKDATIWPGPAVETSPRQDRRHPRNCRHFPQLLQPLQMEDWHEHHSKGLKIPPFADAVMLERRT